MNILAFPLGADGLVNGKKKVLHDYGTEDGCDGMCVDIAGESLSHQPRLESAGLDGPRSLGQGDRFRAHGPRESEAGREEPVGLPSNCEFGIGADDTLLYVTVDTSLYRIRLKVPGYHPPFKKVRRPAMRSRPRVCDDRRSER